MTEKEDDLYCSVCTHWGQWSKQNQSARLKSMQMLFVCVASDAAPIFHSRWPWRISVSRKKRTKVLISKIFQLPNEMFTFLNFISLDRCLWPYKNYGNLTEKTEKSGLRVSHLMKEIVQSGQMHHHRERCSGLSTRWGCWEFISSWKWMMHWVKGGFVTGECSKNYRANSPVMCLRKLRLF